MNSLQEKQLYILKEILSYIDKHNLNYFLVCGSALGAAKYQGFIPWDDDIDIAMPRDDYEVFVNEFVNIHHANLELQNYKYNSNVPFFYSKIRLKDTTFIETTVSHIDMNHGIYIDIFPLDGYPKGFVDRNIFEIKKTLFKRLISSVFNRGSLIKNALFFPARLIVKSHLNRFIGCYDKFLSSYPLSSSDLICNHGNWQGKLEYAPKHQYGNGISAIFEGLEVRIPENYDEYLTQKYGDWRKDLPKEKQVSHHYYEVCDTERSYTEYVEKLETGKIRIKNSFK